MSVILSEEAYGQLVDLKERIDSLTGEGVESSPGSLDISPVGRDAQEHTSARATKSAWFRIQSVEDDYLVCRRFNARRDEEGTKDVAVAKPPLQRRTRLDGASGVTYNGVTETFDYDYASGRERTSTRSDGQTEVQLMTPDYMLDDGTGTGEEILAEQVNTGLTDSNGKAIVWQDRNIAGRYWAVAP